MVFRISPEQQQLRDSALRFVRENASFERWQKTVVAGQEPARGTWRQMADLGWLGIVVGEEQGGLGGSPFDTMVLMEALGSGFVRDPYVGTCVLAPRLLEHAQSNAVKAVLAAIPEGHAIIALALGETDGGFGLADVSTRATHQDGSFRVSGRKTYVPDGVDATHIVVPVRTSGALHERNGITLLLVDAGSPGMTTMAFRSVDHRPVAQIRFDDVRVADHRVLGAVDNGHDLLELGVDHAIAAELAEALGAMDAAADLTLAYLKTREQFGALIGSFQALQHRMADIAMACEETRSLVYLATAGLSAGRHDRRRAISAAKARVGQCGLFVGHQCVQLHGGIGTSDEMAVSHYMRRLRMLDMRFGNADFHRSVFAAMARGAVS